MNSTTYPIIYLKKSQRGKPDWWELVERVTVKCPLHPYGRFHIPIGFTTDFASVPQVFFGLVPPHGVTSSACVVHDYLYEKNPFGWSRREVDTFWLHLLRQSGAPHWQIKLMYLYVRLLGWYTWKKQLPA